MTTPSPLGAAAALFAAGYVDLVSVIPPDAKLSPNSKIKPDQLGKVPGKKGERGWFGWDWLHQPMTDFEKKSRIDDWGANVGLLAANFPACDIDSENDTLTTIVLGKVKEHFGGGPTRLSRGARRLIVFRTSTPFPRQAIKIWYKGKENTVEFLCEGRQYLVHGTHPSGAKYDWVKKPLWETPPNALVEIDADKVRAFLLALKEDFEGRGTRCELVGYGLPAAEREPAPPQADLLAPSLEELARVVSAIPNTDATYPERDDYIRMGHAIKAASGGEGLDIYQEWCSRWDGGVNDPEEVEADWDRMQPPFRIGWQWLRRQAGENAQDEFEVSSALTASSPDQYDGRLTSLQELNKTYAVVQVGGDVVILQERLDGEVVFLKEAAFRLKLKNRLVPSDFSADKTQPLTAAWLGWRDRRQYERVVFKPGATDLPSTDYNLWRGWSVVPCSDGSCELFLDHLRQVVCNGDDDLYQWLLDWIAHLFQFPQEKLGVVVALQGRQGTGKSIVGAVLKKLLGSYQVVADKALHVTGQFNSHLANCLLLQAEEAFWGRDKKAESALKHLVTGERLRIERKGIDSAEMENYTRLLITSNEDSVWPTDMDDRRLVVSRVAETRMGDIEYFNRMIGQLDAGGYEKLLHTLLNRTIDKERLRRAPRTAALEAQAAESMTPEEAWLRDLLESGQVPGTVDHEGRARVAFAALYDRYVDSLPRGAFRKSQQTFADFLSKTLQPTKAGREVVDTVRRAGVKSFVYILPALEEARQGYTARGRAAPTDWPESERWEPIEEGLLAAFAPVVSQEAA
jgi:hypothetical protein